MSSQPQSRTGFRSVTRSDWALILLLVSPAMIIPGGLDRFVFGKLVIAAVGAGLAFAVPVRGRLSRTVRILLAVAAAVLLVSSLASVAPLVSLWGRAPRYEGLPVLTVYLLAGLAGVRLLGPGRDGRTERVAVAAMAWCSLAVGLLAVVESLGIHPLSSDLARPGSLLGNASDQGAFGVLYLGPLLIVALRSRMPLAVVGAAAAGLTVVLSGSRGALVGLLVLLIGVAVIVGRRWWKPVAATLIGAAALALAVPFTRDRVLGLSPLSGQTVTGRGLLWRESLSLLGSHPVLGIGPSQFETAIVRYHDLAWQQTIGPQNPPGSPHNLVLQAFSAGGVLLLAVLIWLGVLVVRGGWAQLRAGSDAGGREPEPRRIGDRAAWPAGVLVGLLGYGGALQFHLTSPGTTIPACLLAGGLLAIPRSEPPEGRTVTRSRGALTRVAAAAVPVLAGLLAVVFTAAAIAEISLFRAAQAVAAGDYAAADRAFASARTLRPWDVDLPGQAMTQFVTAGTSGDPGSDAALPFATAWAARLGPVADDEQLVLNRAALLQATGDAQGSAAVLDRELALDPDNPALLVLRGVIHAQLAEYDAAIEAFTRAAAIDPTDPRPWHDLAYVYTAQGKSDQAAAAQARAQQLAAGG